MFQTETYIIRYQDSGLMFDGLRKQPAFCESTTGFPHEMTLEDVWRNSLLLNVSLDNPDLGSATDWSCHEGNLLQPIRSTNEIWLVIRHQYGIFALLLHASFWKETSRRVTKCWFFSQAIAKCLMSQILISNCIYGGMLGCRQQLRYTLTYNVARLVSPASGWHISTQHLHCSLPDPTLSYSSCTHCIKSKHFISASFSQRGQLTITTQGSIYHQAIFVPI